MNNVLVTCPIDDNKLYCWEELENSLNKIEESNATFKSKVLLVPNSKCDDDKNIEKIIKKIPAKWHKFPVYANKPMDRVAKSRDGARFYAIFNCFSHLLYIDSDVIVTPEQIEKLISHNKPIVSALVPTLKGEFALPAFNSWIGEDNISEDLVDTGLVEVDRAGFGCMLISFDVFEKINIRCERDENGKLLVGEDFCFCKDAKELGFKIFTDTTVQVKHKMSGDWVNSDA